MQRMRGLIWNWNRVKSYIGRPRMILQTKPVVIDERDYCTAPIFIVGAHRSGTSLVRRLFNSHSAVACPPESFFIRHYAEMLVDSNVRGGYEAFGYDDEAMRLDLAHKAASLHEAYRIATGKHIWADKTPIYALHLDVIDALFAGQARFVMVLRHPGDVVHSIFKRNWRFNAVEDGFESALAHVKETIDAMLAFEALHPDRCTRIVYCDLCDHPEPVLSATLAALDLAFEPEMLAFAEQDHNFGLEDPVVRGTRSIKANSGAWRGLTNVQQNRIRDVFGPLVDTPSYWAGEPA